MIEDLQFQKTRLAPTPSGFLHLGNIFSFAITAALAKKTGAKIFLRIDDVDHERTNRIYVQDVFDTLRFLEIPWDEGPQDIEDFERSYSQMHRMDAYRTALLQLRCHGPVFACRCTRSQLAINNPGGTLPDACRNLDIPLDSENVSWRIKTPGEAQMTVNTLNGILNTPFPLGMTDFMIKKKDGFPAYQLTSVVDDLHFGVDLVIRGEDLWDSTLAQLHLSSLLAPNEFRNTTFFHHPLLKGADGAKLSKSAGATSIQFLRKQGKTPADIYSLIAGITGVDATIHTWDELISLA